MNADVLSQDEINALLNQTVDGEDDSGAPAVGVEEPPQEDIQQETPAAAPSPQQQSVSYNSNDQYAPALPTGHILTLRDIPVRLQVLVSKTKMPLKQALALKNDSVVELNKLAGEPVNLYVNQKLFAIGEIIVVDENYGIKLTEILNPLSKKVLTD